jgi:hypothetical protein
VRLAFWIVLVVAVLVLGGISLGAYLVAARKLYSKDEEIVSPHRKSIPEEPPQNQSDGGVS